MTKPKTSRTAWRIVAFLTTAVLGGAALLSFQFVSFNRRQSGLDDAVMLGNVGAVQDLLARGAKVNLQDSRTGWTVLIHASSKGDAAVAEALLEGGADPNLHSKAGTALHLAAYNHHTAIVRALIAHGAEVNAKEGWTVLMAAVGGGSPSVVKLLLAHGANVNAKDDEKGHIYTALKIARSHERIFREHPPRSRLYAGGSDYAAMSSCSSKRERRYDARTRWPPGFDPLKHGAILPKYTSKC